MSETTELIAQQIMNGNINKRTWGDILYNVKVYGARGDGTTDDTLAIQSTIDVAAVNGGIVAFPNGTYLTGNLNVPTNVTLMFPNGSKLSVKSGAVVTINGPVDAGLYTIFTGAGTVSGKIDADGVSPEWWGAAADGVTDSGAAIQKALNNSKSVKLSRGVYVSSASLLLDHGHELVGFAAHNNSDTNDDWGATKLVFTGTGSACITNRNPSEWLLHFAIMDMSVRATGIYDWVFDFKNPIGMTMHNVRAETSNPAGGVMRTQRIGSNPTWTLSMQGTQFRSPDASTQYIFDTDLGDSDIVGCAFTGGKGTILRGTGGVKIEGCILDRSNGACLTISNESESRSQHIIVGNQIELGALYGVLVNADANDPIVSIWCQPNISSNTFRNPNATDIAFVNTTGNVINGGLVSDNVHAEPSALPLSYDPTRWKNILIGNASVDRTSKTPTVINYGTTLNKSYALSVYGGPVSKTGNTTETTLATITVPKRTLGKNGRIRITTNWSYVGTGSKTSAVKFGGFLFTSYDTTADVIGKYVTEIWNRNSLASQAGGSYSLIGSGASPNAYTTSTNNTDTQDLDIIITGKLTVGTETITLESYLVEIFPAD